MSKPHNVKLGLDGKKLIEGTAHEHTYTIRVEVINGQQVEVKVYHNPYLENQCNKEPQMYIKGRY